MPSKKEKKESTNKKEKKESKDTDSNESTESTEPKEKVNVLDIDGNILQLDAYHFYQNYDKHKRTLSPVMTKYEKAKILGARGFQISKGAPILCDVKEGITDPLEIAEEELRQRKTPIILERHISKQKVEYWRIKDLIIRE